MSRVQSEAFPDPVESPVRAVESSDPELDSEARVAALEDEVANLEAALESRTRIGTAIGLLAERYDTTTERAWALLTRLSNHTNSKVQEVARLLVAVTDGTLETADVPAVGELARALPRAAATVGLDTAASTARRRTTATRTRVVPRPAAAVEPVDPVDPT